MGLYGIVVVTTAPTSTGTAAAATCAAPGQAYPVTPPPALSRSSTTRKSRCCSAKSIRFKTAQSAPRSTPPASTRTRPTSSRLRLPAPAQSPRISVSNGGSGYTSAPSVIITGGGGVGATASATIDTNASSPTFGQVVSIAVGNPGVGYQYNPTVTISGGGGTGAEAVAVVAGTQPAANTMSQCQGAQACYPPAVNYTPLYYLINGVAFDKTHSATSLFPTVPGVAATPVAGTVLVRMVNAGLAHARSFDRGTR